MEKISRVSMGVLVVFLVLPPCANALEVGIARLQDGEVRVMGKGAPRDASIYWQGAAVTTSTGGGSFNFTSSNVPTTCVGKVSDGVTTLFIAVAGCTASGVTIPSTVALVAATGQTMIYAIGDDGYLSGRRRAAEPAIHRQSGRNADGQPHGPDLVEGWWLSRARYHGSERSPPWTDCATVCAVCPTAVLRVPGACPTATSCSVSCTTEWIAAGQSLHQT